MAILPLKTVFPVPCSKMAAKDLFDPSRNLHGGCYAADKRSQSYKRPPEPHFFWLDRAMGAKEYLSIPKI